MLSRNSVLVLSKCAFTHISYLNQPEEKRKRFSLVFVFAYLTFVNYGPLSLSFEHAPGTLHAGSGQQLPTGTATGRGSNWFAASPSLSEKWFFASCERLGLLLFNVQIVR